MRISLVIPPAWPVRQLGEQSVATIPTAAGEVVLAWGWLVPLPHDRAAWQARALRVDVGSGATVTLGSPERRSGHTGWPFHLVPAEIAHEDGTIAEHRVGAFFQFLEYGGVALARARTREALAAARAQLVEVLASGVPDWQADGLVVCLHDLLEPLGTPPRGVR